MPKKTKKKERLDKYYYLAKEHGFRSRATFKLVQLNKKYNFFANSTVCIDLCAAPGGWLQAASKLMPISSIKIGVDLDPIKAIPGCTTFVSDITTQDCRNKLEKELKHMKADIVLNDGAPNVGGNWVNDAYNQSELVLFSLKLASEFLKPGGTFVSKVFRSSDYSSLIYVMNQLFKNVEASKPLASRQVSAEIFLVCQGFKGGKIDNKLLDPKYALKQLDDEEDTKMTSIKSIKTLLEAGKGRHRSGYYTDSMYKEKEFSEFVTCQNPYQFFYETSKIICNSEKSKEFLDSPTVKKPKGWEYLFEDLRVLGKSEFASLLFWRDKIRVKHLKKKNLISEDLDLTEEQKEKNEADKKEEYKQKRIKDLEEEIKKDEKSRKKKMEDKEKKKEKSELRQKLGFLKENQYFDDIGNDFDPTLFKDLRDNNIDIEELDYRVTDSESEEESDKNEEIDVDNIPEESDFDEDDYYEMMNKNIEDNLDEHKNEQNFNSRKKAELKKNKADKKKKKYTKKGENLNDDVSDLDEMQIVDEKNSDDDESEEKKDIKKDSDDSDSDRDDDFMDELDYDYGHDTMDDIKNPRKNNIDKKVKFQEDDEDDISKLLSNNKDKFVNPLKKSKDIPENNEVGNMDELIKTGKVTNNKDKFVNPLKKLKEKSKSNNLNLKEEKDNEKEKTNKKNKFKKGQDSEGEDASNMSSDTDDEIKTTLLNKKRKNQNDKRNEKLDKQGVEIVANDDIEDIDNLDLDEIAEIRALAKKMLRKKDRLDIIDQSYNRYAFDDLNVAPEWFNDDEKQHVKQIKPISKAEVEKEREYLREMNTRTPKKVREAMNRKKKRVAKQMDKIKKKANVISNQEEIGEGSKLKQIDKLYKKEMIKNKPQKKYTIVRSSQNITKRSKNVKFVDHRLKKDKRAQKRIDRSGRNKKGNSEKNNKKIEKTKSRGKGGSKNRRR